MSELQKELSFNKFKIKLQECLVRKAHYDLDDF